MIRKVLAQRRSNRDPRGTGASLSHANARECAGNQERFAFGLLDRFHPRRVVPGIDLACSRDIDRVRITLMNLGNERIVRTIGDRCGGECS
jgi:hypothetical protein